MLKYHVQYFRNISGIFQYFYRIQIVNANATDPLYDDFYGTSMVLLRYLPALLTRQVTLVSYCYYWYTMYTGLKFVTWTSLMLIPLNVYILYILLKDSLPPL